MTDTETLLIPAEAAVTQIETLVHTYYAGLQRLCLSILDDPDEAEDAAQETFIAAYQARERFRGEASPKTWLFAIAVNICRGKLRKRKQRQVLQDTLKTIFHLTSHKQAAEAQTIQDETQAQIWSAVDALDEKHRIPVILFYVHELSVAEISAVLEVKPGTVHSRLHYAREQLAMRIELSGALEGGAP